MIPATGYTIDKEMVSAVIYRDENWMSLFSKRGLKRNRPLGANKNISNIF